MATPIWGTNTLTALSNRYLMKYITDVIFTCSPITFRMKARNKDVVRGGTWIEQPWMYKKPGSGGWYTGPEILTTVPFDVVQDGSFPWAQLYNNVTVDGLTLNQSESDEKAMDYLTAQFEMAKLDWLDNLADGFWSDGTNAKSMIGINAAVDNGTVAATYGGITRSTNTWLNAQIDSHHRDHDHHGPPGHVRCLHHRWPCPDRDRRRPGELPPVPSPQPDTDHSVEGRLHGGPAVRRCRLRPPHLQQCALAGRRPHRRLSGTGDGNLFFLNEEYWNFVVGQGGNFVIEDFVKPPNQDAMTAIMKLYCQLICANPARQGKFTALAA